MWLFFLMRVFWHWNYDFLDGWFLASPHSQLLQWTSKNVPVFNFFPLPKSIHLFFIHSFTIYLLSPCHVSSTWLLLNCSRINVSAWLWSYCLFVQKSLLQMISRFLGLAFQVFVDVCCLSCPASIHPVPPSLPGELDFPHRLSGCDPGEANPAFTPGLDTSSKPKPIRTMCSLLPRLTW